MPGRRLWVLLVLGAFFSVHGLQCLADDGASGHGVSHAAAASSSGHAPTPTPSAAGTVATTPAAGHAKPEVAAAAGAAHLLVLHLPAHGAQVAAACLAVLLAGAAALGAVALRRWPTTARAVRGSPPASRWSTGRTPPPRPPDLSALCLLRI
ncbi:hypothetical protein [Blastococcus sp. VKM Ac-2987]|uniref:hypothetical protein n=1 Tax=Blastococcus sp. VKM Ac-2987 TaxID=3004141 RepID=UPI0022AB4F5B|nr:hypothetical protein [Blastococcus sp. VKM Ac-2987]MCZ2860143.1 hypothetical protein [Blastococcus sp. VKM Ac-2987]